MKKGHISRLRKLYSRKGAVEILEYVDSHPACEISDLERIATPFVVEKRLQTFRALQLMTEELELTDEGRKYLGMIRVIESLNEGVKTWKVNKAKI